ncbi:hypothetical protein ASPACDRAFT_1857806 [Aspergillus aculeatus ATCC 16872]|uniref:Uncharacterized protein n=1 Tax=Aspergillus aculeatus (strain ATCC 16872 / CBS 172.66 / WB 5094) TaxID=690307 RepID=A0A1L9WQV2_ASPA1|nr:uncharacterized protein ASPACDRAFT_1857806 [Aspergillus aculeatus ATCC 16872]OJJ98559.1 hypothetical protein ASPACDRAFT_1857806 [Aspergillus aculeatus ATCC 16872]
MAPRLSSLQLEIARDIIISKEPLTNAEGEATPQYAPTPGDFGRSLASSIYSPSSPLLQPQSDKLELVQLSDWEEGRPYDEDPPVYLHYSIEWKVTVNNRVVAKDTEPDLVLAPSAYWFKVLRQKLESRVKTKTQRNRRQVRRHGSGGINAESTSGQAPAWEHVYRLMRCPGKPCDLGKWCWQDPMGKKHYSLKTHHLIDLVKYVRDEHGTLETHDDVPDRIREQLYAEEQQRSRSRVQNGSSVNTSTGNPINIRKSQGQFSKST